MPLQGAAEGNDLTRLLWQWKQSFGRNDGEWNYVGGSGGTICTQIVHDTWEELLKDAEASRKQSMCMIRLWNAFAVVWCYRKDVAVKNRDLVKEIG